MGWGSGVGVLSLVLFSPNLPSSLSLSQAIPVQAEGLRRGIGGWNGGGGGGGERPGGWGVASPLHHHQPPPLQLLVPASASPHNQSVAEIGISYVKWAANSLANKTK